MARERKTFRVSRSSLGSEKNALGQQRETDSGTVNLQNLDQKQRRILARNILKSIQEQESFEEDDEIYDTIHPSITAVNFKKFASTIKTDSDTPEGMVAESFFDRVTSYLLFPSRDRAALKLFGSAKGLEREKKRQLKYGKYIIHPCSIVG